MKEQTKKKSWLSRLGKGACCLVMLLLVKAALLSAARDSAQRTARMEADLANAIRAASQTSTASYAREVEAWRHYVLSARSPQNLRAFVDELIGLEQKFKSGLSWVNADTTDEERARSLFRKHILDERHLAEEMRAAVDAYERMLFEQDRPVFEAAGLSREEWASRVRSTKPNAVDWTQAVEPVITRAVYEARKDVARFAATWVASDLAADGIKKAARDAGWDKSEPGGWDDLISGFVINVGTGVVIETVTDPTDSIIKSLNEDMVRAEYALLDGEQGLFSAMWRLKAAHESARNSLLTTNQRR